ncbi:MAG: PDZ domain-containing protein, partial [Pseudomonadota bacterium]
LKFLAATKSPGEDVELSVLRGGTAQNIIARLAPPPGTSEAEVVLLEGRHPFTGAEVAELSPRLAEELGRDPFQSGVLVNRVMRRSYARRVVRSGDIIVSVNGAVIKTLDDLDAALAYNGARWDVEIDRNGRSLTGTITL